MDQKAVKKTLIHFKTVLESLGIRVDRLILYGSYAIGTEREDSDIDVVVISENFINRTYWERIDILTEAIYQVRAPIEVSAFTCEEWVAEQSLIVDFARNGILV